MRFSDIIGQSAVKRRLIQSVLDNRVAHAQLFVGESGVGKLQLAIAYSQYLACENRTAEDSCGVCPSCLQYQKLQHPDLHFAFPIYKEKPSRDSVCDDFIDRFRQMVLTRKYFDYNDWFDFLQADNKQGVIYEAESSEILRKLSLKSFSNGYKTMIIWLPEKMNPFCANKLLKIIEEPPEQTLFLLVSEEPDRLLSTILSRVQQIKIPRLSEEEIARSLRERENVDVQFSFDLAHSAMGSYLKALKELGQNEERQAMFNGFVELMRNAWLVGVKKNYKSLLELRRWCSEMATKGREQQKRFFLYAQNQIRENYIYNLKETELNYQSTTEHEFSNKFAPFINERNVEQMMYQFDLAQRQIEQNGNAKIILFDLMLQLIVLLKK